MVHNTTGTCTQYSTYSVGQGKISWYASLWYRILRGLCTRYGMVPTLEGGAVHCGTWYYEGHVHGKVTTPAGGAGRVG